MAAGKKDSYEAVTDLIVSALEQGVVPWHRPWKSIPGSDGGPVSASTLKPYRGVNVWTLGATAAIRGYESPFWMTYRHATTLGGHVRKGERATTAVYWKMLRVKDERASDPDATRTVPMLRAFAVFNADQCDDVALPTLPAAPDPLPPIERCERIVAGMPKAPPVRHGGDSAHYSPAMDYVQMPLSGAFESQESYYHTLFHELVHATGHESRVGRKLDGWQPFGSESYAQEELVAELGAAMVDGVAGIDPNYPQSASYIASWLKALKDDRKMIVRASGQAQKAADWILDRKHESPDQDSAA